ncbi:DUF1758 domain-containing protein [Trichonephila clavipes]|nr:DUF1758 domain-containing protein [Trichonephila clavipes]
MIRVFAWILRFVNNCRKDYNKCKEHELSVAEIENSEKQLIRLTQTYYLPDVESLKFVTFIDNDNILRVKSKITERNDESSFLYPILLPDKCEFTKLLIRSIHKKNCHAGIQIMQSLIRERFWIIKARKAIKSILNECFICARFKVKSLSSGPSPLPPDRVNDCAIFEVVGIDLAGPLFLKTGEKEYEELGHMREIKADGSGVAFYMPHHGVYHPEKSTTKLRTIFNASSPSMSGKSLNSIQFNGGLVQEDLYSIMVRFRKHKYAITTDIEKMFRMINIHPEQTCLKRILWKKGIEEPMKTYELTTVTYGTVSAPYLATRTLKQLAMDEANNFPLAVPVVMSDCYMDDILSGSESIEEVIQLQHQLIEMFKTTGMHLHKWCGNLLEMTSNLQEYAFLESDDTKALGIIWNPKLDSFLFRIEQQRLTSFTKKMVLSIIARLFDPLGLFGPIITWAKIFMQRLWLLELGWSDELPFKEEKEAESIELHAFSDASEKAYGSSIYLKSISALGEVKVCLVTSKSRVSPLKQISIPRLELCGAVLAAKLMKKVKEALNLHITAVHLWSDSTIVISWIHRESRELKTFLANRVSKIHQLSSRDQWHHIASEQNPADVLSRGLLPEELASG